MKVRKFANARMLAVLLLMSLMFQSVAKAADFNWIAQFGTPDSDIAGGVAADPTGVYVAGSTIGVFPGPSFDSLVKYLEDALAALNQGNNAGAKQQLGAFVTKVQMLATQGALPPSEAKALAIATNGVIAQL